MDVLAEGGKPSAAEAAGGVRIPPEGQTSETIEGERKTVTALFADIKGSTEMMRDLDPEEARAIVDPALKLMVDAVRRYDGYVVQSTGDGIFALFGAPAAYEDHPQRALYAALRMQEALREHAGRLAAPGKPAPQARVGSGDRRAGQIYAGRACDQPGGAAARRGAGKWHRNQ
jgi:class 3 adenylate cyclase